MKDFSFLKGYIPNHEGGVLSFLWAAQAVNRLSSSPVRPTKLSFDLEPKPRGDQDIVMGQVPW